MQLPGEKVLTKLIGTLEKGIGGALRPWQIRRVEGANTDARIKERLLLEQTERDIADIKSGRKRFSAEGILISNKSQKPLLLEGPKRFDETSVLSQSEPNMEFASAAKDSSDAHVLQQSVNLKNVALFAEEEAERVDKSRDGPTSTEVQAQEVDEDWFSRWRAGAQDVRREEMQRLWANLLTGEVAQPGSFSLHTVNFLSRMSGADAELLSKLAPFQTNAGIVKVSEDFLSNQGLKFDELLHLDDLGLISGVTGVGGVSYKLGTGSKGDRVVSHLLCNRIVLEFDLGPRDSSTKSIEFEVYSITRVGREILALAEFQPNDTYLQAIADRAIKIGAHKVEKGHVLPNGRVAIGMQVVATKSDL